MTLRRTPKKVTPKKVTRQKKKETGQKRKKSVGIKTRISRKLGGGEGDKTPGDAGEKKTPHKVVGRRRSGLHPPRPPTTKVPNPEQPNISKFGNTVRVSGRKNTDQNQSHDPEDSILFTTEIINNFNTDLKKRCSELNNCKLIVSLKNKMDDVLKSATCLNLKTNTNDFNEDWIHQTIEQTICTFQDIKRTLNIDSVYVANTKIPNKICAIMFAQKGECLDYPNSWSIRLICNDSHEDCKGNANLLMAMFCYALKKRLEKRIENGKKEAYDEIGFLEVRNNYENMGAYCLYNRFNFKETWLVDKKENGENQWKNDGKFLCDNFDFELSMFTDVSKMKYEDIITRAVVSKNEMDKDDLCKEDIKKNKEKQKEIQDQRKELYKVRGQAKKENQRNQYSFEM